MAACEARGIAVFPARGANDISVAEYVIAAAMLLLRGAYAATSDVIAGSWPRNRLMGREISGKRLGLVGFGSHRPRDRASAPRPSAWRSTAFDPLRRVRATRPGASPSAASSGSASTSSSPTSDVVSLHVPLTPETRDLLGARRIGAHEAGRGPGQRARAAASSTSRPSPKRCEPAASAAPPSTCSRRSRCPRRARRSSPAARTLILTPHIAGVTVESNVRVSWVTAENVRRHLAGA